MTAQQVMVLDLGKFITGCEDPDEGTRETSTPEHEE